MIYFLLVFVITYVYIKTPKPVIFHESIEPMIPGSAAKALSANLPYNCDKAFNLFFIHSLAPPPFPSPALVLSDVVEVVDTIDLLIKLLSKHL